jgi:hypothetical protein
MSKVLFAAFTVALLTLGACSVNPGGGPEPVARTSSALGDESDEIVIPPRGEFKLDLPVGPPGGGDGGGPTLPLRDYGLEAFSLPVRFGAHVSHTTNMNGEDDYYSAPDGLFTACFNEYTHL